MPATPIVSLGGASLFTIDTLARHAEAGISLLPSARGRGIGTAAISAYEKAGFVIEGRQRQHAWVRGAYEDIVLMGILRSEPALRQTHHGCS